MTYKILAQVSARILQCRYPIFLRPYLQEPYYQECKLLASHTRFNARCLQQDLVQNLASLSKNLAHLSARFLQCIVHIRSTSRIALEYLQYGVQWRNWPSLNFARSVGLPFIPILRAQCKTRKRARCNSVRRGKIGGCFGEIQLLRWLSVLLLMRR